MVHTASPLGQLPASVPATSDPPDVRSDLALLIGLIEPFINMRYATRGLRDNAISAAGVTLTDGMLSMITGSVREIDVRMNSVWVKMYPLQYSGTVTPANSIGVPGDIYVQYA